MARAEQSGHGDRMPIRRIRHTLVALVLLAVSASASGDAFTDRVVATMREKAPELTVSVVDDNELAVKGAAQPLTLYLDNIRARCSAYPTACDAELRAFIARVASIAAGTAEDSSVVLEKLFVVLRPAGFASRAGAQFADDLDKQLVVRPFVDGIEAVYVVDTPDAFRFVSHADRRDAELTPEQLHVRAASNATTLPRMRYSLLRSEPEVHFLESADGLGTARLFNDALWQSVEERFGRVAVAVPTRDWIVFAQLDDPRALELLHELADRIVRGEPYPISSVMFRRVDGGWQAVPHPR